MPEIQKTNGLSCRTPAVRRFSLISTEPQRTAFPVLHRSLGKLAPRFSPFPLSTRSICPAYPVFKPFHGFGPPQGGRPGRGGIAVLSLSYYRAAAQRPSGLSVQAPAQSPADMIFLVEFPYDAFDRALSVCVKNEILHKRSLLNN